MSNIAKYNTVTFNDVFENVSVFLEKYHSCGFPVIVKETNATTLYYLLVARFGNSPIANSDVNQFVLKLFSIVFQFGPTWEKRLEIQEKLRNLTEDELLTGSTNIYNTALNPETEPTTHSNEELKYINQQNVNKFKRAKPEAYATLWSLLKVDVTENLLKEFKVLFKTVVRPESVIYYNDDCGED